MATHMCPMNTCYNLLSSEIKYAKVLSSLQFTWLCCKLNTINLTRDFTSIIISIVMYVGDEVLSCAAEAGEMMSSASLVTVGTSLSASLTRREFKVSR